MAEWTLLLLAAPLFLGVCLLFVRTWRGSALPAHGGRWLILAFPLSQLLLAAALSGALLRAYPQHGQVRLLGLLILPVHLAADLLLLRLFRRWERRQALRRRQEELEHRLAVQEGYYQRIAQGQRQVQQLRHDINNQLQTVLRLVEAGQTSLAREQLGQLSARLQRTGEPDGKEDAHVERTSL